MKIFMENYIQNISTTNQPFSIESGYFIFTLMPSLRCSLNCPHCYLTKEQRRYSPTMSLEDLEIAATKVDDYYSKRNIKEKVIVFYWYGGEPTEMGFDYMNSAFDILDRIFDKNKGYLVKHTILTSLLTVDTSIWFPFFRDRCQNHFQTSFDGFMRGENYVKKWEKKVKEAIDFGLTVGTISVVNNELLKDGATNVINYLTNLGVKEVSFLPFMWNEQNNGLSYDKYAPSMDNWSKFMIDVSKYYFELSDTGIIPPSIGQLSFVMSQSSTPQMANIAGQTLFLLPNGDFVLPDYKFGFKEYMRVFGNILTVDFTQILAGKERKSYLRKQVNRDNNPECLDCEYSNMCVMEFWKKNRPNDDCFGGKKYIEWLLKYIKDNKIKQSHSVLY